MASNQAQVNPFLLPAAGADAEELARRQKYADLLRQQSMEPYQNQEVSGHIIPYSWTQGVAQLLKGAIANKVDENNKTERIAMNQRNLDQLTRILGGGSTQPQKIMESTPEIPDGDNGAPVNSTYKAPDGTTIGDTGTQSVPMPQQSSQMPTQAPQSAPMPSSGSGIPTQNNFMLANLLKGQAINALGGEQAAAAYWDQFKPTTNLKEWAAQGISPEQMRALTLAEAKKKGIIELQPGTTALDLATGAERFQPKVGEGITLDQGGNASAVPGYAQANAGITRANEGAKASYEMVPLDTPNGRIMVTKEQAAQMAGGQPQQGNNIQYNVPGARLDLQGMNPQEALRMAEGIKDPQAKQQYLSVLGQWANQGRPQVGIPLQGEGEKTAETERGKFFGNNYAALQQGAMDANTKIAKYDRMANLLEGVNTGKLTPAGTELAAYAQSLGLNIDPKLGNKQASMALANEIALQLRNPSGGAGMPGALSDKDREFLMSMTPSLGNTPEGNAKLIEGMKALAKRDQEIAQLARNYKGGNLDNGFYQVVQDYANRNPLFSTVPKGNAPVSGGFRIIGVK